MAIPASVNQSINKQTKQANIVQWYIRMKVGRT